MHPTIPSLGRLGRSERSLRPCPLLGGIGMNEEDLVSNLGTIARSGTKNFVAQLSGDARKDSNLIGQFGVGFYSVFMVSDRVEVVSRKAGEEQAWRWTSDGRTGFSIEPAERAVAGTTVMLHFNEEGKEYANSWRLQQIVKKYSNHIAFPIFLIRQASTTGGRSVLRLPGTGRSTISRRSPRVNFHTRRRRR
jgi:HSP90 family molecular chaperone